MMLGGCNSHLALTPLQLAYVQMFNNDSYILSSSVVYFMDCSHSIANYLRKVLSRRGTKEDLTGENRIKLGDGVNNKG